MCGPVHILFNDEELKKSLLKDIRTGDKRRWDGTAMLNSSPPAR